MRHVLNVRGNQMKRARKQNNNNYKLSNRPRTNQCCMVSSVIAITIMIIVVALILYGGIGGRLVDKKRTNDNHSNADGNHGNDNTTVRNFDNRMLAEGEVYSTASPNNGTHNNGTLISYLEDNPFMSTVVIVAVAFVLILICVVSIIFCELMRKRRPDDWKQSESSKTTTTRTSDNGGYLHSAEESSEYEEDEKEEGEGNSVFGDQVVPYWGDSEGAVGGESSGRMDGPPPHNVHLDEIQPQIKIIPPSGTI